MKKKAAIWAQEGIERVHCTGDDMEKQRCLMRDDEIAKRVAMIRNCRIDIPFPKFPTPYVPELGSTWEPPGDILEPDVLKDLVDEETVSKDEGLSLKTIEELLEKLDYSALRSPPRFTEGWPQVKDYEEIKCD
ncbi:hypothetical protein KP509_29G012800 [Ceratopteris richardii]|nr:hypothetical protein KP509_29G012800 [Ceratopteris richardii]